MFHKTLPIFVPNVFTKQTKLCTLINIVHKTRGIGYNEWQGITIIAKYKVSVRSGTEATM